ncbi:hypothetical protein B0E68_24910 [Salmonella enterica]|nr:hypothetical protein [Salmonella enterica]
MKDSLASRFTITAAVPASVTGCYEWNENFCSKVSDVMRGIKKFPAPPSDAVYQKIKDSHLDFKP